MILLATNGGVIHLIDAFQGTQLHTFTVSTNVAVREILFFYAFMVVEGRKLLVKIIICFMMMDRYSVRLMLEHKRLWLSC